MRTYRMFYVDFHRIESVDEQVEDQDGVTQKITLTMKSGVKHVFRGRAARVVSETLIQAGWFMPEADYHTQYLFETWTETK